MVEGAWVCILGCSKLFRLSFLIILKLGEFNKLLGRLADERLGELMDNNEDERTITELMTDSDRIEVSRPEAEFEREWIGVISGVAKGVNEKSFMYISGSSGIFLQSNNGCLLSWRARIAAYNY
jgi:hypothetical protein